MKKERTNSGIGVLDIFGIVFVILKIVGVINWSWWMVLAPFWVPLSLAAIVLVILAIVGLVTDK